MLAGLAAALILLVVALLLWFMREPRQVLSPLLLPSADSTDESVQDGATPGAVIVAAPPSVAPEARVAAADTDRDGAEPHSKFTLEDWKLQNLEQIDRWWARIEAARDSGRGIPFTDVHALVQVGLTPVLLELGLGQEMPLGVRVHEPSDPDVFVQYVGGVVIRTPRGTLPVYDRFHELWAVWREEVEKLPRLSFAPDPSFPTDEAFLAELEDLALRAKAAIARRTEWY